MQLFPSQGFSQGGVLVTIEISNLADIPATAKDYSCIFKISSVSLIHVAAARDDRVFSCIQPSLPAGSVELYILVEQMQVGPGVPFSVLNTIQLRKVEPSQMFVNASDNVELVIAKLPVDAGNSTCLHTALVRVGRASQAAVCSLNASSLRYFCRGFTVTMIGAHELEVSICGELLRGSSLSIHVIQQFSISAAQPSRVFASISDASVTLYGSFYSPVREATCFQNSVSIHTAVYISDSAVVCKVKVASAGVTGVCIGVGSVSNAACIEIHILEMPAPFVLTPNRIPSLLENAVTFIGTNFSALTDSSIRCELKKGGASLTTCDTLR